MHTLLKFDKPQKQLQVEAIIDRNEKDLTLFDLIQQSKWAEAAAHVRTNPLTARHWITIARETGWRRLPLHEACIRLATPDFIDILIEAYPEAVEEPDHSGRLPVQHACFHGASLEIVEKLVLLFPRSLKVHNIWGKDPIVVARGAASANRSDIIAALSKGSEFSRKEALKEKWAKQQETLQKMRIRQYQELIQMQETKIKASFSNAGQRCQEFERLQNQYNKDFDTLTEMGRREKEKFLEVIYSIKGDVSFQQTSVDLLNMMVQGKDQRLVEVDERLRTLRCDLDETVNLKHKLKEELTDREREIVSLTDSLQEVRSRNEYLTTEASKLSLKATRLTIALNKEKRCIDARQREISPIQEHNEEVLWQYAVLTEKVEQQEETTNSLTDRLKLLDAGNVSKTEELADVIHQLGNLNKLIETKESEIQCVAMLATKKAKIIEGRNSHLENERGKLSQRILH